MSIQYLLDTNIVTRIIRKAPPKLSRKMLEVPTESIAISVVTEAEILFGLERRPDATQLAKDVGHVLLRLQKLPWTSGTARAYATLRHAAERRGAGISAMDLLIASQARENNLILVTNDSALHKLQDLMPVEDWIGML